MAAGIDMVKTRDYYIFDTIKKFPVTYTVTLDLKNPRSRQDSYENPYKIQKNKITTWMD